MEYPDSSVPVNGASGLSPNRVTQPQPLLSPQNSVPLNSQAPQMQSSGHNLNQAANPKFLPQLSPSEPNVTITLPQTMFTTYLHLLQTQTQTAKLKLEYLRRREEQDRENSKVKQRAELATELLANQSVDGGLKETAVNYLKGLFKD